jgi:hypothetical protein
MRLGVTASTFWLAALTGAGCVASGTIRGRLTVPGTPPAMIAMQYRSERFAQNGTIRTTLPSGEAFTGRYLQVTSDTTADTLDPYWDDWGVGWAGWGPWSDDYGPWVVGADMPTFVRNYSGKVIATLIGDRGDRMRCRFRLASPEQGMSSGGVGECEVTGGGKIAAEF